MRIFDWIAGRNKHPEPGTPFYQRLMLGPLRSVPWLEYDAEVERIMRESKCSRTEAKRMLKEFERRLPGFVEG